MLEKLKRLERLFQPAAERGKVYVQAIAEARGWRSWENIDFKF